MNNRLYVRGKLAVRTCSQKWMLGTLESILDRKLHKFLGFISLVLYYIHAYEVSQVWKTAFFYRRSNFESHNQSDVLVQ